MPQPTSAQIIWEYVVTILHYWWALLPGLVMPLRNVYKWFHPEHKELEIPHWIRLGSVAAALFLAQFLAYRNLARNLAIVIEEKRQFSMAVNIKDIQLEDARHQTNILKMQKPQPTLESKNSLRKRVVRLTDDLEALVRDQNATLPSPEQAQTMTPEQKNASKQAFDEAAKRMTALYLNQFRSRTVGIIAELKAKGLMTDYWDGPLEKGAEFRPLGGGEIQRLRELAYHLDGQDKVTTITGN
jgi:hypothetical protein